MAALRTLTRTLPLRSLRSAPTASITRSSIVMSRRTMASTPDSSHVSEHKVEAPHSPASHEAHQATHDDHYESPTGWLWGIAPDQKYENEGWEGIWYYGFCGSLLLGTLAYAWKPDTSIETWALEEAKRRLQAEGTIPEDGVHPQGQ